MLPAVVSAEVERALLDYLLTTFHLKDKALEAALFAFLRDDAGTTPRHVSWSLSGRLSDPATRGAVGGSSRRDKTVNVRAQVARSECCAYIAITRSDALVGSNRGVSRK